MDAEAALAVLLTAVLVAAGGCGGRAVGARGAPDAATDRGPAAGRPEPVWMDSAAGVALDSLLARVAAYVGDSRSAARRRLGRPYEERRRTMANRHVQGAVDTTVRLVWKGAAARFHKSGANQREFLTSVEITGNARLERLLPARLRGREGLRRILGAPDRVDGGRWIYVCCRKRPGARESLVFRLRNDRIAGLRAGYFVD